MALAPVLDVLRDHGLPYCLEGRAALMVHAAAIACMAGGTTGHVAEAAAAAAAAVASGAAMSTEGPGRDCQCRDQPGEGHGAGPHGGQLLGGELGGQLEVSVQWDHLKVSE